MKTLITFFLIWLLNPINLFSQENMAKAFKKLPNEEKNYFICVILSSGRVECWTEWSEEDLCETIWYEFDAQGKPVPIPKERTSCEVLTSISTKSKIFSNNYFEIHSGQYARIWAADALYQNCRLLIDAQDSFAEPLQLRPEVYSINNGADILIKFLYPTQYDPFYDSTDCLEVTFSCDSIISWLTPSMPVRPNSTNKPPSDRLMRISENDFLFFPNPAKDKITLTIKNGSILKNGFEVFVEIYDLKGEQISRVNIIDDNTQIPIQKIKKGQYFFVVKVNDGIIKRENIFIK